MSYSAAHTPVGPTLTRRIASGSHVVAGPPVTALLYPAAASLLVVGLPGAGKTTLLRRISVRGARVLDSQDLGDELTTRLSGSRLGSRIGRQRAYRLLRPLVHLLHRLRAVVALRGREPVIVHEPGRRAWLRRALAAVSCQPVHLLLVRATPEQARSGQAERARSVPDRRFAGHARTWHRLLDDLERRGWNASALRRQGFASLVVVERSATPVLTAIRFGDR